MTGESVIDFVYGVGALAIVAGGIWGLLLVIEMMPGEMVKMVGGGIVMFPMCILVGHAIRMNRKGR